MIAKMQPRHESRRARIRQLEARVERLTELLDELYSLAVEALGEQYVESEGTVVPESFPGLADILHQIAERSGEALADTSAL